MFNKQNISSGKQKFIIYSFLTLVTIAVFWQVNHYGFINYDDQVYVKNNIHIQSGITLDGFRWAFSPGARQYADLWNPLVWISFMFDYQAYGLNSGGYHLTNLILHVFNTLMLFWLFCRVTGALWKSAFVAALFAIHPLHVESVVWIAERKDVLSAFFWMLTLCFYILYTEKPVAKRYLLVLFSFVLALMSKPMVVTLPLILILMDYWPLNRFALKKDKLILWQLKEKLPFFILSAILVFITLYNPDGPDVSAKIFPLGLRLANTPVAFATYLYKTLWPYDMAIYYPFQIQIHFWQVLGSVFLILVLTVSVILAVKRFPFLFFGWFWYAITVAPVIGILQVSVVTPYSIADRYHYLPSIGLATGLAWGIPLLFSRKDMRKNILFPAATAAIVILAFLAWRQCGYWKNSTELFNHTLKVTKNNYLAHNLLASSLTEEKKIQEAVHHCNEAIRINPFYADAYYTRGNAYFKFDQYQVAIDNYNKAIALKPGYSFAYNSRGGAYFKLGLYQQAVEDYNEAIRQKEDYADAYYNRGNIYSDMGQYQRAIDDYDKAILIKFDYADAYNNRGIANYVLRRYQKSFEDFNETIRLKPDYGDAYNNRGTLYLNHGYKEKGCADAQKACALGVCKTLEVARIKGICR